jgi:hypothetical protein
MKKLSLFLICFLLLSHVTVFSQMQVGGGAGKKGFSQSQRPDGQGASNLSIDKMTQLNTFDASKVIKALKVKTDAKKLTIIYGLETYNNKLIEIKAFNNDILTTAKKFLKSKIKESKSVRDPLIMNEARVKLRKMLAPIIKKVSQQKKLLNQTFKKELTEKEYGKWLKYLKSKTHKKPNQNQLNSHSKNGRGQGKGRQNY